MKGIKGRIAPAKENKSHSWPNPVANNGSMDNTYWHRGLKQFSFPKNEGRLCSRWIRNQGFYIRMREFPVVGHAKALEDAIVNFLWQGEKHFGKRVKT